MKDLTIDLVAFEELKATAGAEFVGELVDTFLTEAPGMLADLRRSFDTNDADRFRRAAHSLKSNSSTFGATTLATLAKKLELDGVASVREAHGAQLDALEGEYARVSQRLRDLKRA